MILAELVHKLAVLLAGENTPEVRADIDAYLAANPPPPCSSLSMTPEEFDAYLDACGGPEVVRRSARAYYGLAD
jgi:hypothetical protein